jgi:hypothetical protein
MPHPRTPLALLLAALVALAVAGPAAAAPSFSVSGAGVSPNPVQTGVTAAITVGVRNGGTLGSGIIVDMEVFNSGGTKVFQQYIPGLTFAAGETKTFQWFWAPPAGANGTHTVKVGVFADRWAQLLMWNNSATTFTVQGSGGPSVAFAVGTVTATPVHVERGGTVSIAAPVTNTGTGPASGVIVMLHLRDPLGNEFEGHQQIVTGQSFAAGQTRTYSFSWRAPASATGGAYSAAIGVFNASWSVLYVWKNAPQAFSVGTAAPLAFAVGTTTVAPATVARGGSVTLTTQVTNTSASPATGIVILAEINNAAGNQNFLAQYVDNQTFAPGQTRSLAFVFSIPATLPPATYTVDIGVFNATWSTLYTWGFQVADFDVQ